MKLLLLLFLVYLPVISYTQENNNEKCFSVFASGGVSFNEPISWYFYQDRQYTFIKPGIYSSLGIEYGPIDFLELSQLYFSTTISYTNVSVKDHKLEIGYSSVGLDIETIPVLFWIKLKSNTRLSPYIEAGMGLSKLNFIEDYSSSIIEDVSFHHWSLGYGFGAGVSYNVNPDLDISLGIQYLSNEKEKVINIDRYYRTGIWVRNIVVPVSLRISMKVF